MKRNKPSQHIKSFNLQMKRATLAYLLGLASDKFPNQFSKLKIVTDKHRNLVLLINSKRQSVTLDDALNKGLRKFPGRPTGVIEVSTDDDNNLCLDLSS